MIHFDDLAVFIEAFIIDSSEFEEIIILEGSRAAVGRRSVERSYFGAYFCGDVEYFTVSHDFTVPIEPSNNIYIVV